jgi:hypothetical protein
MVQSQHELRLQLEQLGRMIAGRLSELEGRMDTRLERIQVPKTPEPVVPLQDRVNQREIV